MNKKSDIVKFFEAAGIDVTKGKAKLLIETMNANMFTHTFIIEDGEESNSERPLASHELQAMQSEGQKFQLPEDDSNRGRVLLDQILPQFIKNCGPYADQVRADLDNDSHLNEWLAIVLGDTSYHTVVMWSVEYDINLTAIA